MPIFVFIAITCVIPCASVLTGFIAYVTISCTQQFTYMRLTSNGVDMFRSPINIYEINYILCLYNTSWGQPMGKDTQAFRRLFSMILWMLNCDWTYMCIIEAKVDHKGASFYVVCFWVIIWQCYTVIAQCFSHLWCHNAVGVMPWWYCETNTNASGPQHSRHPQLVDVQVPNQSNAQFKSYSHFCTCSLVPLNCYLIPVNTMFTPPESASGSGSVVQ